MNDDQLIRLLEAFQERMANPNAVGANAGGPAAGAPKKPPAAPVGMQAPPVAPKVKTPGMTPPATGVKPSAPPKVGLMPIVKKPMRVPQVTGLAQGGTPTARQIKPRRQNVNVNAAPSTPGATS